MLNKLFWLLGIALLVGTFGAGWVLSQPSSKGSSKDAPEAEAPPPMIICWGHYDLMTKVADLYPRQFGRVVKVIDPRVKVKKGDVLLEVDSELHKLKLAEADADIEATRKQLEEVDIEEKVFPFKIEELTNLGKSHRKERDKLEIELDAKLKLMQDNIGNPESQVRAVKAALEAIDFKIDASASALKQLQQSVGRFAVKKAQIHQSLLAKAAQRKQVEYALSECKLVAPSDGEVMKVNVAEGETLGPNPRYAAVEFAPKGPRVVRAEVIQEWGSKVALGQETIMEDDTYNGPKWKGKVKTISGWYAPTRSPVIEPFRYNDVRTLECLIEVTDSADTLRLGQRLRVKIKI